MLECESIAVELVAAAESIGRSEPVAWWLTGDVLAITRGTGAAYEKLAPAAQAMLGRHDLLKDLRLVMGALGGLDEPSLKQIEAALERAEIDVPSVRRHQEPMGRKYGIDGQPSQTSGGITGGLNGRVRVCGGERGRFD